MTFAGRVVHPAGDGVVYGAGSVERHLAGLLERCAVAVDNEFADDALTLPLQAEIALLPPVSGG